MTDTALTPAQKRAITRRANAEKRARLAAEREAEAKRLQAAVGAARKPYTWQDEASLLVMMDSLAGMLADCRAELAATERRNRRELAQRSVVSLADWREARAG